jgi:hypothetical protein
MSIIPYYTSGKYEAPLKPPQQKECRKCAPVEAIGTVDDFDTERDAQVAFKWGNLEMLNSALKRLWPAMWNSYQCVNKDCTVRHACGNQPTYFQAFVEDVAVPDATAPAGTKQVWRLFIKLQRKIECIPAVPGQPEKDDPPEPYKELPPQAKEEKKPAPAPEPKTPEPGIPALTPAAELLFAQR